MKISVIGRKGLAIVFGLLASFVFGVLVGRAHGVPFFWSRGEWAIGIATGTSPLDLSFSAPVRNPVLSAKHVTDVPARFVADPFVLRRGNDWYLFFEVMNERTRHGDIGVAHSKDGLSWAYRRIVLDEPFHLSYPYVFEADGQFYMVPETRPVRSVRLYRASDFPWKWEPIARLLDGDFQDPSVIRFQDRWWMLVGANPHYNDTLRLYHAEALPGPWLEHPRNPIVASDACRARPAGRLLVLGGRVIRFAQDDWESYGDGLRAFEVTKLTTSAYEERELSLPLPHRARASSWAVDKIHHLDVIQASPNRWLGFVDGYRNVFHFGLRR